MKLKNPIATGNTSNIYLYKGKIIKLFNDFLPDTEAEYEAGKQRYAYNHALPVPYIYGVTRIRKKQAIVMEYVPGRTIGVMIYENMEKAEQYMNLSVDIQIKIHSIKADGFELMTDRLSRQLRKASVLSNSQKEILTEKLYSIDHEKRLCHGDYHVFNLILDKNKVTIIDWVDSAAGDIKADICRTYLLYSQYSPEMADIYLKMYCDKSGLSQDDILVWEPIIAGARLSEKIPSKNIDQLIAIVEKYCQH